MIYYYDLVGSLVHVVQHWRRPVEERVDLFHPESPEMGVGQIDI
jgi:hypothetical protein